MKKKKILAKLMKEGIPKDFLIKKSKKVLGFYIARFKLMRRGWKL